MDLYSLAPVSAALDTAASLLDALVALIHPFAGASSTAVVIVVVTIAVRACLIPVGVAQARAERTRRRLAPLLSELRRRYGKNPDLLRRKTLELYAAEKASPLAGCLPLLAQAPVLSLVYGLFALPVIDGHPNALQDARLGDAALGESTLAAAHSGWEALVVHVGVLLVIAVVAWFSRRFAMRTADAAASTTAPSALSALSWLPFLTLVFATFVPLAAAIYLAVTTAWTLGERYVLRALIVCPR